MILSDQPVPECSTDLTFEFHEEIESGERRAGKELPQVKELMGKVTLNPESCLIRYIPFVEHSSFQTSLAPDRMKWDLYLIDIPFTLHRAPGGCYYRELTFFVELDHPQATAFDLFPRHVTTVGEETKTYIISPQMRIQEITTDLGQSNQQIRFASLRPEMKAFGEGENEFYWIYKGVDSKEVMPEIKHVLIVLQVPRGTASVDGSIHYMADIASPPLRGWMHKDGETASHTLSLKLKDAPLFPVTDMSAGKSLSVVNSQQHCDVCIICALAEEAQAFREKANQLYGIKFEQAVSPHTVHFYKATLKNMRGEPLTLHLSWLPKPGPLEAGLHIKAVLEEFQPYFAGMTGFCAGDRTATSLGDLIIAESAFNYDSGKFVLNERGDQGMLHDTEMWHPQSEVLQFARDFTWPESADCFSHRVHIAPMAAGEAVRADNPFPCVRALVRKAIALDMESAAFYRVLAEFPTIRALLVKGVADYADNDKHDDYHHPASANSAWYMLAFIREYVTSNIIPSLKGNVL